MKQISEMLSVYINGLQPQGREGKIQTKLCFTRKSTELLNIRQLECAPIALESAPLFQGTVKEKKNQFLIMVGRRY